MKVTFGCSVSENKRGLTVKRRSRPSGPKLTVLRAQDHLIECQLETSKQKTVTFQFNLDDTVPADVANNLASFLSIPLVFIFCLLYLRHQVSRIVNMR